MLRGLFPRIELRPRRSYIGTRRLRFVLRLVEPFVYAPALLADHRLCADFAG